MSYEPPPQSSSHVNGRGLWRSWQRNFRRPLDALLDLVDNAVEAVDGDNHRHDDGYEDKVRSGIRIDRCTTGLTNDDDEEGILLMNTAKKLKPMDRILEVFSSDKHTIGENGVGIKQASANLSHLSLVVTRIVTPFHRTVQIGVLSAALQHEAGLCLPSYTLSLDRMLEDELENLITRDTKFAECLKHFGGMPMNLPHEGINNKTMSVDEETYLDAGRERLMDLIEDIHSWGNERNSSGVFCLILARFRISESAQELLKELQDVMPTTYIHAFQPQDTRTSSNGKQNPLNSSVCIDNRCIGGQYWERRLAALAVFHIDLHPRSKSVRPDKDQNVFNIKENNAIAAGNSGKNSNTMIRIFLGFDPLRSADDTRPSTASLYVYSCGPGRLIKHIQDARNEMQLYSSGSRFCQGLTVILDDYNRLLPLTPTKQDIAWSDKGAEGEAKRKSVYAWLRGVTNLYYTHYETLYKSKGSLNDEVKNHCDLVRRLTTRDQGNGLSSSGAQVCPLMDGHSFNRFVNLKWGFRNGRIQVTRKEDVRVEHRSGTVIQLKPPPPEEPPVPPVPALPDPEDSSSHPTKKRRTSTSMVSQEENPSNRTRDEPPEETKVPPSDAKPPPPAATTSSSAVTCDSKISSDEARDRSMSKENVAIASMTSNGGAGRSRAQELMEIATGVKRKQVSRKQAGESLPNGIDAFRHLKRRTASKEAGGSIDIGHGSLRRKQVSRKSVGARAPPPNRSGGGAINLEGDQSEKKSRCAETDKRVQELEMELSRVQSDLGAIQNLLKEKSRDKENIETEYARKDKEWEKRVGDVELENQRTREQLDRRGETRHHQGSIANDDDDDDGANEVTRLQRLVDDLRRQNSDLETNLRRDRSGLQGTDHKGETEKQKEAQIAK